MIEICFKFTSILAEGYEAMPAWPVHVTVWEEYVSAEKAVRLLASEPLKSLQEWLVNAWWPKPVCGGGMTLVSVHGENDDDDGGKQWPKEQVIKYCCVDYHYLLSINTPPHDKTILSELKQLCILHHHDKII